MKHIYLAVFILFAYQAFCQGKRTYYNDEGLTPREHPVDFYHLRLEVAFEPKLGKVTGKVSHSFVVLQEGLDSLFLDAPEINIKKVSLKAKELSFKTDSKGLTIKFDRPLTWDEALTVDIEYECFPKKGIYFIGWNDTKNLSRKQIWTQGQGTDNRYWIPHFDSQNDKISSEIIVSFDKKYKVLSNGRLITTQEEGQNIRWHYRMEQAHASYLIMLGIGEYDVKTLITESGKPINLYYYPEWANRVEATYKYSKEMFEFFEHELMYGYVWGSYSQIPVQDFLYGAMENTSATVFGDFFFVDEAGYNDRNYVSVNAHELAHQWFGDLVTARSAAHHWLQESFATHYNLIYEREAFGEEHFQWARRSSAIRALEASKKDLLPIAHSGAGTARHYPKGALVLNMLRYTLGNDAYRRGIAHYLEKHAFKNVDSDDLLTAFHEKLGVSLNWFWEQWVYKGGEPHYQVAFEDLGKESRFDVKQIHELSDVCGLFKMPIVFEVHYSDGSMESKKVWIENPQHTVSIPNPNGKKVAFVLFDPSDLVLKKVTFNKSPEMLMEQSLKAPNMIDRYDALVGLRASSVESKLQTLLASLKKETHEALVHEALGQLSQNIQDPLVMAAFASTLKNSDVKLRRAAVRALNEIPQSLENDVFAQLNAPSYELQELSLRKLFELSPQAAQKALQLTAKQKGNNNLNVRIAWLELSLSQKNDEKLLSELVEYISASYEFRTRALAAQTLKKLNLFNPLAMQYLFEASVAYNARLAQPCFEVLKHFAQQTALKPKIQAFHKKFVQSNAYRQEKLKPLFE
jgi:aminopeptidase N